MEELALSVRSLGKSFSKGKNAGFSLLRQRAEEDFFWALQDVSFDVPKGVGVGIIGGNGAGKSTLLKILSRIVLPTVGEVEVRGKINSLLEVGTGFQPELSGRENIYLNGSILGMSRKDIDSVYDEIVDFSGVGQFIDMPVKHYSSGMYSRLAFSVGANVTGDILLIDEVLAVGDAEFRKCLGRMEGLLTSEHRTVLFVSHSMESVMRFCTKTLWLDRGKVRSYGDSEDVVREYLQQTNNLNTKYRASQSWRDEEKPEIDSVRVLNRPDTSPNVLSTETAAGFSAAATITSIDVMGNSGAGGDIVRQDAAISVEIELEVHALEYLIHPVLHLHCLPRPGVPEDAHVFTCVGDSLPNVLGRFRQAVTIPANFLAVGQYSISVALVTRSEPPIRHCKLRRVLTFQIIAPKNRSGTFLLEELQGVVQPQLKWSIKLLNKGEQDGGS